MPSLSKAATKKYQSQVILPLVVLITGLSFVSEDPKEGAQLSQTHPEQSLSPGLLQLHEFPPQPQQPSCANPAG